MTSSSEELEIQKLTQNFLRKKNVCHDQASIEN